MRKQTKNYQEEKKHKIGIKKIMINGFFIVFYILGTLNKKILRKKLL